MRGDILRTLWKRSRPVCTTMFDFYGMPDNWPGRTEAARLPNDRKGEHVEEALRADLAANTSKDFRPELFIPFVQVHEFEALLFADVARLVEVLASTPILRQSPERLVEKFKKILDQAGQPEAINDGRDTCPSRRIKGLVPGFEKLAHGTVAAGRIGIEVMKRKCPHFAQWVKRLEALGADGSRS